MDQFCVKGEFARCMQEIRTNAINAAYGLYGLNVNIIYIYCIYTEFAD